MNTMNTVPLIFIVDDDRAVRESIRMLLESAGYRVRDYASAKIFLQCESSGGDCLIADIRMPEMDGLELQEKISRSERSLPIIIMTGHGDAPLAVRAMKAGAIDFIEKPFDDEILLESIEIALRFGRRTKGKLAEVEIAQSLIALLTPREREVLDQLVAGQSNKAAAHELGISSRTAENHRASIMVKMSARSVSDLVRIALAALRSPALTH
jgi:two-component system response regulator FixJ